MGSSRMTTSRVRLLPRVVLLALVALAALPAAVIASLPDPGGCSGCRLPPGVIDPSFEGNSQPPGGDGPAGFALSVTGRTKDGGTATPTVARPAHLGLLVEKPFHTVDMVRLGAFAAGTFHLHWNLKVDGKPLPAGKYAVFLELLSTQNLPTGVPPCRDEALLTVSSNGHDRVRMATIKYPAWY